MYTAMHIHVHIRSCILFLAHKACTYNTVCTSYYSHVSYIAVYICMYVSNCTKMYDH